jgi:hypothetical protein
VNEKQLKKSLRLLADDGWFGVKITDEFVDGFLGREWEPRSDELKERFVSRLRIRIQDAAIKRAYPAVDPKVVSFGHFIWAIREIARITRAEIGARLGKGEDFVQRVEEDEASPVQISLTDFADLITLFQIKINDATPLITNGIELARVEQEYPSSAVSDMRARTRRNHPAGDAKNATRVLEDGQRRRGSLRNANEEAEVLLTSLRRELAQRRRTHRNI